MANWRGWTLRTWTESDEFPVDWREAGATLDESYLNVNLLGVILPIGGLIVLWKSPHSLFVAPNLLCFKSFGGLSGHAF